LTNINFVLNGSVDVINNIVKDGKKLAQNTVVLQDSDVVVAEFNIKPSKTEKVTLDNLVFDFA
jgi:hypothetical protein